mmetsp:Transcript_15019/g.21029  ORF Transcript_15019/g.21029 Transcript_15019/m.21029 type:complete len:267 (+) Transcript_15019:90-890(+)|eukprot:CAMPEP_0201487838 /NCGR_PEP_ID=MMETSP0151_2-20130828/15588_1 /ASSEMBLY_ACC=CAM_ASM_000257 /TAXON_ID=200890 /ORGANISM="Paramoeba atlantica, Strain 621/1 / CCAP 1560/9" /LENGTH=266 /DNA_ID=CAMNT_0047872991 /DNA_START=83 /DNA_END=883 /DNA_ORIENTATION=+
MGDFEKVVAQYEAFKRDFDAGQYDECSKKVTQLKLAMMGLSVSFLHAGSVSEASLKEFLLCRHVLELAALLSIKIKDMVSFERNVVQVKTYYETREGVPPSEMEYTILGLHLVNLLSSSRHSEFLTELELIPFEKHESNHHIRSAVQLENWLVAGSYSKVFAYRQAIPADDIYCYPLDLLLVLTRKEMGGCIEKAYKELPVGVAQTMLNFSSQEELLQFMKDRPSWVLSGETVTFLSGDEGKKDEVPTMKLIARSLEYAKELERIV